MVIIFKCVFFVNTSSKFNVNIILDDFFLGKKRVFFADLEKLQLITVLFQSVIGVNVYLWLNRESGPS